MLVLNSDRVRSNGTCSLPNYVFQWVLWMCCFRSWGSLARYWCSTGDRDRDDYSSLGNKSTVPKHDEPTIGKQSRYLLAVSWMSATCFTEEQGLVTYRQGFLQITERGKSDVFLNWTFQHDGAFMNTYYIETIQSVESIPSPLCYDCGSVH